MRLDTPRIGPVAESGLSDEERDLLASLGSYRHLNIFRTLVRAPEALKAFLAWGGYVMSDRNALPAREREIVILRTGYLCKSGYEWTQHDALARTVGLTAVEISAIKQGADAAGWNAAEKALLMAADELHDNHFVSDAVWAALLERFSEKQCMDVVFTAGQYTQVSMFLNTFGVQLDDGQSLDPDLRG
jgi:4-carboxymuconolactone decarboxylase